MIALLKGIIAKLGDNYLILDVNGVGYKVFASSRTLSQIGGAGDFAMLHIETHVREDHIHLFGFATAEEQEWFNILCTVQGVGAKMGLSILSAVPANQIAHAIAAQDKAAFTQADGVGPKLGVRIVTELKDKAAKMVFGSPQSQSSSSKQALTTTAIHAPSVSEDALSALMHLGYSRVDAFTAITKIANNNEEQDIPLQDLIRLALKELSA